MGLDQSADLEVIKTVYRVLARKYHPDVYDGPKEKGEALFRELNKAFDVLSNQNRRTKYNESRNQSGERASNFNTAVISDDDKDNASHYDSKIDQAWKIAERIYPDINNCRKRLGQINSTLAIAFTSFVVENKSFGNALSLANQFQEMFLSTYFGKDKRVQSLALELIIQNKKSLALDLNKIVKVTGIPDKTNAFIDKFLEIHDLSKDAYWKQNKITKKSVYENQFSGKENNMRGNNDSNRYYKNEDNDIYTLRKFKP